MGRIIHTFESFSGTGKHRRMFHLTDNPRFSLDREYAPEDNAIAIYSRSGRKGIYLTGNVERWINGYGYDRPFVVEFLVDESIVKNPEFKERWGGEIFLPAHLFDELTLDRVIPTDAHCREIFQSYGWYESITGKAFDTGETIVGGPVPGDYRYTGKDVRNMSKKEIGRLLKNFNSAMKIKEDPSYR
jgi:hypothetical protein